MLIKENNRFKLLFVAYMKSLSSYSSSSSYSGYNSYGGYNGYGGGYSGYSSSKHIYFYEWSRLDNGSKQFDSVQSFLDYLSKCDISITNEQKNLLESNSWCYATCVPNKKMLIVATQYFQLRNKLEECNKSLITSLIPCYR